MQQFVKSGTNGATKADQTKARLIAVTKRLIQEHGSDRITLRSIAASARMKAGSIYYHFDSKDEIVRTVLENSGFRVVGVPGGAPGPGPPHGGPEQGRRANPPGSRRR